MSDFCSPFDEAIAQGPVPAVFLQDHEGLWRFHTNWSRNAWTINPGPHPSGWRYGLFQDQATRHVQLLLVTGPTLLASHQRGTVHLFETRAAAQEALAKLGRPPLAPEGWTP